MTSLRSRILPVAAALALGALVVSACSSTSKTSTDSGSTTTTAAATTTAVAASTTAAATTPPTTAKSVTQTTKAPTTNPPATIPPATSPQIITSFSVSSPAACAAPDVTFVGSPPSVTVSWSVVGADSVSLSIDSEGGLWNTGYGLSGSDTLPASCDGSGHNVHTYYVIAIKGGQKIASKSATRGS